LFSLPGFSILNIRLLQAKYNLLGVVVLVCFFCCRFAISQNQIKVFLSFWVLPLSSYPLDEVFISLMILCALSTAMPLCSIILNSLCFFPSFLLLFFTLLSLSLLMVLSPQFRFPPLAFRDGKTAQFKQPLLIFPWITVFIYGYRQEQVKTKKNLYC